MTWISLQEYLLFLEFCEYIKQEEYKILWGITQK